MQEDANPDRIRTKLSQVLDPCSCLTEEPVNIVELGLVKDVYVQGRIAHIELLLTSPGCAYYPNIALEIEDRVTELPDIDEVEVVQTSDEIWTEERMADGVRKFRRERMHERLRSEGISPFYSSP